jgi:hypothetical protein
LTGLSLIGVCVYIETDAAAAALAAAGAGTGDLTWTQSLTDQARAVGEAAQKIGRRAGLDSSAFSLAPDELATSSNS